MFTYFPKSKKRLPVQAAVYSQNYIEIICSVSYNS